MPSLVRRENPARCHNCGQPVTPYAAGCWLCGAPLDPARWQQPPGPLERAFARWRRLFRRRER